MRVLAPTATLVRKFAIAIILSGFVATVVCDNAWSQAAAGGGSSSSGSSGSGSSPGGNSPPPPPAPPPPKMAIRVCDVAPCPPKPKKLHRKIVHHPGCRVVKRIVHTASGIKVVHIRHCRRH